MYWDYSNLRYSSEKVVSIASIYHKHFKPFSDQTLEKNEFISQNEVKRGGEHVKQLIDVTSPTLSMVNV